ncbi:extracellular metallo proteinase 2 [Phaeosphaeriaceae sp. PMI808]|nr:extracellular metallo proteinase 2 [Phaeosphaeriaceae sp. PMI808]
MRSFLLASLASLATIKGTQGHPHHSLGRRGVDLNAFRMKLPVTYINATAVVADPTIPTLTRRGSVEDTATELVKKTIPGATFRLADNYVGTNGIAHLYFKQTANGIDIDNGDFNVNIGRDGMVFSFGNSFFTGAIPAAPSKTKRDTIEPVDALKSAVSVLDLPVSASSATAEPKDKPDAFVIKQTSGVVSDPEARLVYIQTAEGNLALTWRIETDIMSNWLLTYVDAKSGKQVHAVVDYAADATYQVYPWGLNDPTEGERVILTDPFDKQASDYNTTRGNNGVAQNNAQKAPASEYLTLPRPVSKDLKFEYPYSLTETDPLKYSDASVTQLFYTANVYHDLLYKLGFTEQAGNFEVNNNGQGGIGNDFVFLNTQDGTNVDNANFATPPDGQAGRMRMYMWTRSPIRRDCSFEAGVVIHEYTHGLSNRLTGGPSNSNCLNVLEAGGMGEGWGDFYATAIRLKAGDTRNTDYSMGSWVNNKPAGIRAFLYSTNMKTNPQTYSTVDSQSGVHAIGTIWANMLYEVLWNLIDKHGKNDAGTPTFDSKGVPTDGKYLAMKLVLDGMTLQPCNPNFVSARDAIIDADKALTGGANACPIWTAFAKRGLGDGAKYNASKRTQSFKVPTGAC